MRTMNNRFKVFLSLAILYAMLIFYLSSSSSLGDPMSILDFLNLESLRSMLHSMERSDLKFLLYPLYIISMYPDKAVHIILYAGFGFLLYHTLKNSSHHTLRIHAFIFAVIIGTAYGASDELHQSFVPGRTASIWDLLADSIGISMAQAVIFMKERFSTSKKKVSTLDLKLSIILIILSIIFILIPSFNQTFFRIIFALPLLLFLPGYLLIAAMFPKRGELSPIERFTLSIGLSIAITVFDGFALNYTPWGYRPNSIVISLSLIMGILLTAGYLQRQRLRENAYGFSTEDIASFYRTLRSKETETGPEYNPALEKMLIKTMVIAILLVSAMLVYAKVTTEPEKFTALYILGANGKAENYPTEVRIGEPTSLFVGVENYEHEPVNYTLSVKLGGKILKEENITLDHDNKWLNNITFIPQLTSSIAFAGANRSKLEFQLIKDNKTYRSVHLLVNTSLVSVKFAELPGIINGNMESDEGWLFSGSQNITGSYRDNISSSRVYEINFTVENQGSNGTIYQNLTTDGDAPAIISFDVRDSEYSNISYYVFKQALLDGQVVWESGIGGKNSSWEHVEVPVLLSWNNTLAFRVYGKFRNNYSGTVWWDNVQLRPYIENKVEPKRTPLRKVQEFKFDVRGSPLPLEKSMRIDGFGFAGFHYDINENKSSEELSFEVSDNDKIDAGNATYIVRVNGSELYLMGSRYRILGKEMPTNLSRILEINSSKMISLGEKWSFWGAYSLSVNLISSKGDSAMLELKKSGNTLDSKLVSKGGTYEYRTNIGKLPITLFRAKVDSISGNNIYLTGMELYSDIITVLKPGAIIGDFEVTNISSDEVVFKNSYPFELNDKTVLLNGSMGLSLRDNMLYPYSAGVPLRGTPQHIHAGDWMNITGFNYPGFYMGDDTSFEDLSMYFSDNGLVETGQAVYRARMHQNILPFLGESYELVEPYRPGYISTIIANKKIILYGNETQEMGDRFMISFQKVDDDHVKLNIKRYMIKNEQNLLNKTLESNVTFFPDFYYEMFTGQGWFADLKKSNVLKAGERFEYWIEYKDDRKYKAVAGELEAMNNNSIELSARVYKIPFEISPGKTYGEFEVESVTGDAITLSNTKPLRFMPGNETAILNGALKIKTSSQEYFAYPIR